MTRTRPGVHLRRARALRVIPLALAAASIPTHVSAEEITNWSALTAGCIPESASIYNQLYYADSANGEVGFAAGKTGTIRLTCPVNNISTTFADYYNKIALTSYWLGCGAVTACLLRTSTDSSGSGATIGCISPGSTGRTETVLNLGTPPPQHTWNPNDYYYWVDVVIIRSSTSCNPRAIGTRLFFLI